MLSENSRLVLIAGQLKTLVLLQHSVSNYRLIVYQVRTLF